MHESVKVLPWNIFPTIRIMPTGIQALRWLEKHLKMTPTEIRNTFFIGTVVKSSNLTHFEKLAAYFHSMRDVLEVRKVQLTTYVHLHIFS
jgi:hypothetical protein